jgi:NADH-quinone oxidoreductase subunit L
MLWLLALLPATTGALLLATGLHRRSTLALIASLGLAATLALVPIAVSSGWTGSLRWSAALALQATLTPLSALVAALVPAVALPVLVYASYRERDTGLRRLISLLLLFCGAMELLVIADDLLTLLIGWEIVGACSWALIAHEWRDAANPSSARYAFVVTRFGDLGLFLAAMSAYAGIGSFAYADLARLDAPHLAIVAFGVVLSAAAKSGQVPFSPWLFRAMAGPASVSALLHAATMVAAGAYLLARLESLLSPVSGFGPAIMAIGTVTALAGGLVALLQPDVKKVLAASTSAHFGLIFVAVGAGFPGVAVLHLVAHGFFKALLFLCAGIAIDQSGSHELSAMRLGRALPIVAVLAAIGAAALAGLPPLGAAWTKDTIATAAAATGEWWSAAVIVAGGLSAAYSVRWIWLAYGPAETAEMTDSSTKDSARPSTQPAVVASIGWLTIASVLLSALWLPMVRDSLAGALSIALPRESATIIGAAIAAVAVGALTGRWLGVRMPKLGHGDLVAPVADWWRLAALIELAVITPMAVLARASARVDDLVIDAIPRAIGQAGTWVAAHLAREDNRVVDRGVGLTTTFIDWLSRATSGIGELVADGIALGPARLVSLGAHDAQRLQTGLSHHAFAVLLFGTLALGAFLFFARL